MKKFLSNYWKSIIVVICILYLSFTSPSTFDGIPTFENEDKLVHLLMYGGLTGMLIFDFRQSVKKIKEHISSFILSCIVFPILLGGLIEILQPRYFAPRTGSWGDFAFNTIGVFIGLGFMWFFKDFINSDFMKKFMKDLFSKH